MMRTPQSRLIREAMTFEPDAGRYVHIRPRQLPPGCLDRLGAIARMLGRGKLVLVEAPRR